MAGSFDDLLEKQRPGSFDDLLVQPSSAQTQAPVGIRSVAGEVYTGLKRGVVGELPKMVGQAAKWATEPESGVYKFGQGIVNAAEARLAKPEIQLNPEGHNAVTNALASGAEMLAPSVAIPLVVGAGLAAAPEAAVGGALGLGISALAGAVPMGMAQAQDTMERVKEAGGDAEAARIAGWKSGAIEAGGETVGTYLGGKLLGIGGKVIKDALKARVDEGVLKPFAKQLAKTATGEVATEMGQGYGQATVEKNAGVDVDPWQQAKETIAPTLGMTALLAPFGLAGHIKNARVDPAVEKVQADTLNKVLPEGATLDKLEGGEATVTIQTASGTTTIKAAPEDIAKQMLAGKPLSEMAKQGVESRAARLADLEAKALGGEQFTPDERKEYQKLLTKSGTKKFEQLQNDPVRPEVVRFRVADKVYEYAPPAGMSRAQIDAELATRAKSPGSQFNWLKKNTVEVKDAEVKPQATPANEPVQAVQPGPEQVVDGVSEPLTVGENRKETSSEGKNEPISIQNAPLSGSSMQSEGIDNLTFQHDTLVDQWEALPAGPEKTAVQEEIFKIREEMNNAAVSQTVVPPEGGVDQGVAVAPEILPVQTPAAVEPAGTLSQVLEGTSAKVEPANARPDVAAVEPDKLGSELRQGVDGVPAPIDAGSTVREPGGEPQSVGVDKQRVVEVAAKVDKDLKYDGDNLGMPQFTYQAGPLKGVTFSAKDASEESVRAAAEKMKAQWEGKKNNAVQETNTPAKVTTNKGGSLSEPSTSAGSEPTKISKKAVKSAKKLAPKTKPEKKAVKAEKPKGGGKLKPLPSAYAVQAKVIAEDIAAGDTTFKRVPSDAAIRAYREKNPRAKADAAMAEMAEMDEAEYQGLTAVIEDEQVNTSPTETVDAKADRDAMGDPSKAEAEKVQKGIEGKTLIQAAEWLINNTPNNGHKLIAAKVRVALLRLKGAGVEFNLNITHVGDKIPTSSFNSRGVSTTDFSQGIKTTVRLNGADVTGKVGVSYETVLHEMIHAATQAAIHVGNRKVSAGTTLAKATSGMIDVTNLIIDHFNARAASGEPLTEFEQRILQRNVNALNNPSEVLAWTLSNKEMQDYLETVKLGKKETLWSRFVQSVRTFFGLTAASDTALSEVLRLGEDLLNADANQIASSLDKLMGRTPSPTDEMVAFHGSRKTSISGKLKPSEIGDFGAGVYLTPRIGFAESFTDLRNFGVRGDAVAKGPKGKVFKVEFDLDKKDVLHGDTKLTKEEVAHWAKDGEDMRGVVTHDDLIDMMGGRNFVGELWSISGAWDSFLQKFGYKAVYDGKYQLMVRDPNVLSNPVEATTEDTDQNILSAEQIQTPFGVIADEQISEALKSGQKKLDTAVQALKNPKSKFHDLYVQYAPQWLAVTPLHTLVQTFGKTIPQIKNFSERLNAIIAAKEEIVSSSKVLYDKDMELAQKGVGVDTFNAAAGTASFNRMTPWLDIYSQEWAAEGKTKSDKLKNAQKKWVAAKMQKSLKLTFIEAYSEAKKAYDALKTDELKQAYQDTVEHIGSIRTRDKNNLLQYIEKMTEEGSDERKEMMRKFEAIFADLHGAYWPLARVGDFVLKYVDQDGFKWSQQRTTIAERNELKADIIAAGVDPSTIKESYKDKQPAGAVAIPAMMLEQLSKTVRAKYMKDVNPNDSEAVEAAMEAAQNTINDMTQIWLRWQPETSALKNSVRRKNVKGYSLDMLRSYLDYMQRHASNIAWTEQGKKIEGDLKSMGDDIKAKLDSDTATNTDMENHLLNDLRARVQALRSVKVGVAASFLGKIGTGWYMTSPSIALVQMTQLGALTLPKLAVKYGPVKAAKALALWTKESFKKDYRRAPMFDDPSVELLFDELHAVVTIDNRNTPAAKGKELGEPLFTEEQLAKRIADELTPYQRRLLVLREAMARNLLDISAAHEAYDLTRGKDPDSMMSKVFNLAMKPMSLSELTSRKAAVLSTYDLASQDGKDFFLAMNDIAEVVNDTLYSYSKENKGAALQGGLTRVVLQFQHYRIMTGIRLAMLLNNAIRGESKEIKAAATKEFVGIMGMTGALAGSLGMPFAGTVFAILGAILGDDDEPEDYRLMYTNWLQDTFPKTVADLLTHGLPSLAGADISKRVGLQDVYGMQSDPPPRLHGKELAAWWAANQLGPVFSVGAGLAQGYDEMINKGNYMKGLEAAAPKPIKDVFKAIRVATDGVKTGAGKKLIPDDQIGPDEVLMIALGFNPEEISKAQGAERSLRGISTRITERRGKLIRRAAEAILEGDGDSAAMEDIRKFNLRMPRFAIGGRDIKPAVRKILRGESGTTGKRERDVATQYDVQVYTGQ